MSSPHGIPVDLLDRLVIVRTETYGPADMIQVRLPIIHRFVLSLTHFRPLEHIMKEIPFCLDVSLLLQLDRF